MKLLTLDLHNFRGARGEQTITPNGKNMVILGPNGTGKSTFVDAIDFLLTGKVSRLLGEGTAGITLSSHGRHVDAEAADAWVRAEVALPGIQEPVTIERHLDTPRSPIFDARYGDYLNAVFTLAHTGQHVLTRRDVLRFVTATPSRRGELVQEILGIDEIKRTRATLNRVKRNAQQEAKTARATLQTEESALAAASNEAEFNPSATLSFVNDQRHVLGAEPLTTLTAGAVRQGIDITDLGSLRYGANAQLLLQDLQNVRQFFTPDSRDRLIADDARLREAIQAVRRNPHLRQAFRAYRLVELGLEQLAEDDACPLCGHDWPAGELQQRLRLRLSEAEEGNRLRDQIKTARDAISQTSRIVQTCLAQLIAVSEVFGVSESAEPLTSWSSRLEQLTLALQDPLTHYPADFNSGDVAQLMASTSALDSLQQLDDRLRLRVQEVSPEQTAYDALVRVAARLEQLAKAQETDRLAQLTARRASALAGAFERASDEVINGLYDTVCRRFQHLYRELHSEDEGAFTAALVSKKSGVTLDVDYYGRGSFPPTALHSEGHQDSMGVCLFLALAEHINQGKLELVVLDDVLMAIDADHRRAFSQVLQEAFPNNQFLITTHDKTWASQLRHQGFVQGGGFLEISGWDLKTGPRISSETDLWERIDKDLAANDVPAAAARLRRGAEEFFALACHNLKASVPYDMTQRYDLGVLLQAAKTQHKVLIKKAKAAADSWNDQERLDKLTELDEHRIKILQQLDTEQWAVNPAVHYNNWENFTPADFEPVVTAFQGLQVLFICSRCGAMLNYSDSRPQAVRCRCGHVHWPLEKK